MHSARFEFKFLFFLIALAIWFPFRLVAVSISPIVKPLVRLEGDLTHPKMSMDGRYIAFVDGELKNLQVFDLKAKRVFLVSKHKVGGSFFWAPDGVRLFYKEHAKARDGSLVSRIRAYDSTSHKSIKVASYPYLTGPLSFDPTDLSMRVLSKKGVHSKKVVFPGNRLAKWQVAQRSDVGRWLMSDNRVYWLSDGGFTMKPVSDSKLVLSFSISPDGKTIAWANDEDQVFTSRLGSKPHNIGYGRDPNWHPQKKLLIYSAARRVGSKSIDYDIKVVDEMGSGNFLTQTPSIEERWPVWSSEGNKVFFTRPKTTDLYAVTFNTDNKGE